MSNCIRFKVWDQITYPFQNFNGAADRYSHPTLYLACDYLLKLWLNLNHIDKSGHSSCCNIGRRHPPRLYLNTDLGKTGSFMASVPVDLNVWKAEQKVKRDSSFIMASSKGNIFLVTGHLCGEFTGHRWIPPTKASDAELWCILWSLS